MTKMTGERPSRERQSLPLGNSLAIGFAIASLALGAPTAFAQDVNADRFTIRGFGSLAATWQDAEDVEFRRFVGQPRGVGEGQVELFTDSIAGLPANARIHGELSPTVQGVTRLRADGNWDPRFSQAYLRWSPDESWVVRAG